jgi:xanthine dehydrogenase YagR molybdenum-binding subunit
MAQGEIVWGERAAHALLNTDLPRVDGPAKVTGRARYSHDVRLPGMLYARVLCCPHPCAKPAVDLSKIDVPGEHVAVKLEGGLRDGVTTWLWQPIAAVAAETPELAEDALRQIAVSYEEAPWAVTAEQALAEDAPRVGKNGNVLKSDDRSSSKEGGGADKRQEAEAAFGGCDAVVEATYTVPVQHHAALETHGVVVDYRGGDEATIYASTQHAHGISGDAAKELGLERSQVRCIVEHMGGGFGAKFGLDLPGMIACRLAKEAQRPIHLFFTRRDEFLAAGNRSGAIARLKGGMRQDGTLAALTASISRLGGFGQGSNAGQPYIYRCESYFTELQSVLTNTDGSRAMRAPGHPQASFAMESLIDELAAKLGLDQLEVRKRNLVDPVYQRQLDRVAKEIGWAEHPNKSKPPPSIPDLAAGIGFAVSTWGGGGREGCQVDVRIERDGSVIASCGTQDLGTGSRTYLAAIVAEELGLPLSAVTARIGDSLLGNSVGSGGSVTTGSLAPAAKVAAHKARLELFRRLAPVLDAKPEELALGGGKLSVASDPSRALPWAGACASLGDVALEVRGEWQESLQGRGVHGAQAARVEVDTLTGEVRVKKLVAIQDCGLPLNRLALRSQINGGAIEALSYGLFEERIIDPWLGVPLNAGLDEYKLAGTVDIPELVAIVDDDDPRPVPIGMAEATIIPGHAAVANAVYNACGARIRELPLTPDKVLMALQG